MIEIPRRMLVLPRFKGLPMPVVQFVGPDGTPDFKVLDEAKRQVVLAKHLCGICGQRLDPVIALIGGDACEHSRLFMDPPMHKECARFAAAKCPYLNDSLAEYSKAEPRHLEQGGVVVRTHEAISPHRPKRLAIFYSRGYTLVRHDGAIYVRSEPFTSMDWSLMPERNDV